jgi:diguanylate cyclase (GGDEF)-like protein
MSPRFGHYAELRDAIRWRMAVVLAALMLVLMLALGISNSRMGLADTSRLAWIVFAVDALSLLALWRLPKRHGALLFFGLIVALLVFAVVFGGWHGRSLHYWGYLFPPVVVFLLPAWWALAAMIVFGVFTAMIGAVLLPVIEVIRFASVYGLLVCFVTTYALLEAQANRLLRHQSARDALTGCWNRRAFNERMAGIAQRTQDMSVALLLLDLDHFKSINDRHGHLMGDTVLRTLAHRLSAQLRAGTALYRYGGEEFAIIAQGMDLAQARALAERLRQVAHQPMEGLAADAMAASIGLALWQPTQESPESALRRTDAALYRAKAEGRNRVVMAEPAT